MKRHESKEMIIERFIGDLKLNIMTDRKRLLHILILNLPFSFYEYSLIIESNQAFCYNSILNFKDQIQSKKNLLCGVQKNELMSLETE